MPYGYHEFPHVDYDTEDMQEFINLYKDLLNKYSGTLDKISMLTLRLDEYERNMDANLEELRTKYVPDAVKEAVEKEMEKYWLEVGALKEDVKQLKLMDDQINDRITEETAILVDRINEVHSDVLKQMCELETYFNCKIAMVIKKIDIGDSKLRCMIFGHDKMWEERIDAVMADMENLNAKMTVHDAATLTKANKHTDDEIRRIQDEINTLQVVSNANGLKLLWQYGCCWGGYNAIQWYRDTEITAEMWHDTPFTCIDWYIRGREVFNWWCRRNRMFSPVTGKLSDVRTVINEICQIIKLDCATAGEYEDLQINAGNYDNKEICAFNYDWKSKEVLNVQ